MHAHIGGSDVLMDTVNALSIFIADRTETVSTCTLFIEGGVWIA